jgi:hypothetical protein
MQTKTLYEANTSPFKKPVTEAIKTFEDACKALGKEKISIGTEGLDEDEASIVAYAKLSIIVRALNEGWKPNWQDASENKYYPYFRENSGVGLSFDGVGHWTTLTRIGSRLCFKSRELAEYAGKQFEDIYKQFLIINN